MRLRISPLRKNDPKRLSAADGHALVCVGIIGLTLTIQGLKIPQTFPFLVVKDLNFKMILGLDFLNATRTNIDFNHNTLSVCDDLVIEPLLPSKKPNNVLRVANNCTIPPLSEAVIAMTCGIYPKGQFLLTSLPTVSQKHISLAHAIVNINKNKTQCRILNPTNAPITLHKRATLATVTPISNNQIFNYDKSKTTHTTPTVDFHTQLKTLADLGIETVMTDYTQSQKEQLVDLLYNNRDLFTSDICKLPGTDLIKHTIDTGTATPIRQRPYRHSPEARKEIDRQVDKMLESGIIEESTSPWASPVVFVKKKSGGHRLCVDMRKLSALTKPIFFPLPLLEDVFQLVAENNASVYSTIDLSYGYYQLFSEDSSKPKTCFVTHRGSYQYTRVCFGLQGAAASFNYLMHHILRNILFSYSLTYVDDCICFRAHLRNTWNT